MEGTACYRYRQVARYLLDTGAAPVKLALDIGANVGDVTAELLDAFPQAYVHAFEILPRLVNLLQARFAGQARVKIHHAAVTGQDGLAWIWEALPSDRPGWAGGSVVAGPEAGLPAAMYRMLPEPVEAISLDSIVDGLGSVDYVKSDCEGSEASFLPAASVTTLRRIRWLGGEYHGLARWWPVHQKLASTHRVNLVAEAQYASRLGSFFAERISEQPGLLGTEATRPQIYDWGLAEPLWWHPRKEAYG